MTCSKKSYGYTNDGKIRCFHGHISKETACKHGFLWVALVIFDKKGIRTKYHESPFINMLHKNNTLLKIVK